MNIEELTLEKAHQGLNKKEFSSLELTEYFFNNIKKKDKKINAFVSLNEEYAKKKARIVDKKIKSGEKIGPLAGLPMAVKDNILIEGLKTTAGSRFLENYVAPYDATVIKKLKEEHFVPLGKTNMDEFAMGASTENSAFFATKNPLDSTLVPGGSSGGSAAAVAGGECLYALGSDTGGSIRQPAAFCGVVGLRPTYGRVSRYGLVSLTSSIDVIGTLTKNVHDAAIVLETISGFDKKDSTSGEVRVENYSESIKKNPSKLKIGIPKEYYGKELDGEVKEAIEKVIKKVGQKDFELIDVSLPHTEYAIAVYYIVTPSEVSTNLSRYDGIKYGLSDSKNCKDVIETYFKSREKGFGAEPKRRIMLGTYALSSGYHEAYYLKALKVRRLINEDFAKVFSKVDILVTPTTPTPPFKIGEKQTPLDMYLSDIFLAAVGLAGLPAISLPFHTSGKKLPFGVQLIANHFEEMKLLKLANFFEQEILDTIN